MAPNELASLLALATAIILSALVIFCFRKPMNRILADQFISDGLRDFWVIYTYLLVLFLPAIGALWARPIHPAETSILLLWMDQLFWSLVGMVMAIFCSAFGVSAFISSSTNTIKVSADQADDLQRLLIRVEEIRARDIIRRSGTGTSA
jgi:hypothetical protein